MKVFWPPLGVSWQDVGFSVRTTAASLIALYIAFVMQLDSPQWAAGSVWIVAQADRGASLSKGIYRAIGTIAGAAVALLLLAFFAQSREVFLLGLALWLGICTGVATAWRHFRAYAAVLAGYTAAIIGLDAVVAPQHSFDIAVARTTYVLLGVLVESIGRAVFCQDSPLSRVKLRLDCFLLDTGQVCASALMGRTGNVATHRLFVDAVALDAEAHLASTASADVQRSLGHVRAAILNALAQLVAAHGLQGSPTASLAENRLRMAAADLCEAEGVCERTHAVCSLKNQIDVAFADSIAERPESGELLNLHRLTELLAALEAAETRRCSLAAAQPPRSRIRFSTHLDWTAALQNGIRASVATLVAAAFWIGTAWPSGASFVAIVAVVCTLFATRDRPIEGGCRFLIGAAFAAVAATVCNLAILPTVTNFEGLAVSVSLFLIPAGLAIRRASTSAAGSAFAIFFWNLLSPSNSSRPLVEAVFNGALAVLLGIAFAIMAYALLFPQDPRALKRRVLSAISGDIRSIARRPGKWSKQAHYSRASDRVAGWLRISRPSGGEARAVVVFQLAALDVGDALIELHSIAKVDHSVRVLLDTVIRLIRDGQPGRLALTAEAANRALLLAAANTRPKALEFGRAAALFSVIASARPVPESGWME